MSKPTPTGEEIISDLFEILSESTRNGITPLQYIQQKRNKIMSEFDAKFREYLKVLSEKKGL